MCYTQALQGATGGAGRVAVRVTAGDSSAAGPRAVARDRGAGGAATDPLTETYAYHGDTEQMMTRVLADARDHEVMAPYHALWDGPPRSS